MADTAQSSNRSFMAIVGALVAVVGVVFLVVRGSRPSEPDSGPAMTTVMIVSDPAGATVTNADGGVLGVTPFDLTVPKSDGELPVTVRRDGYQDKHVTVPLFSATGRVDVMMTKVGEKPPEPPKPPPDGWTP
ncbi:MAG TPA: PEGA domain-containing protein [Polyangia bacterium]|nr:PEGA domain-containing protein [Polyangia bacterium]